MKKILSLLLLVSLCLSLLSGCGAAKPVEPAESAAPEEVYAATFQTLRFPGGGEPEHWALSDGTLYAARREKLADGAAPEGKTLDYEGQYDVMGWRLYHIGEDGAAAPLAYEPLPAPEDTEGRRGFSAEVGVEGLQSAPDGGLLVLESQTERWYTGEEETPERDPDYWDHIAYEPQYVLRVLDQEGRERSHAILVLGDTHP